jgi:co-chaperonin GroES (HSP10)
MAAIPDLEPIGDRIVVRPDVAPKRTAGGIELPDEAVSSSLFGTVIAVGPGLLRFTPRLDGYGGDPDRQPMQCQVGDRVVIPPGAPAYLLLDGDKSSLVVVMPESNFWAIIRD